MARSKDSPRVIVEGSPDEANELVAELFKTIICESVDRTGACNLALAGGTTPHGLYQQLAKSCGSGEVAWPDVAVYFGDERDVPQDHVESNYSTMSRSVPIKSIPCPPMARTYRPPQRDMKNSSAGIYRVQSEPAHPSSTLSCSEWVRMGTSPASSRRPKPSTRRISSSPHTMFQFWGDSA